MVSSIDRRLKQEIDERSQRARAGDLTEEELALQRYEVSIELRQILRPRKGRTREETLDNLKQQAKSLQASIVKALKSAGIKKYEMLPLSNSIKVSLTVEEINEIAKHPDVKIIRYVTPDQVIT